LQRYDKDEIFIVKAKEVKMRHTILPIIGIFFLAIILFQPAQASDANNLENRIHGFISSVNSNDYNDCLSYVAPPEFTGGRGLTRNVSSGQEYFFFRGQRLLPFSDYQIRNIKYMNDGYESEVNIKANVIYQGGLKHAENERATNDIVAFPASINQQWVLLDGKWFIKSLLMIQL
jgi:hypothetical protein